MTRARLDRAVGLHAQGRVAEAENLYRGVLASDLRSLDARHMLGAFKAQQGCNQEAHDLIALAVAANRHNALALENLGNVLRFMGRFEEALQRFDEVLALAPGNARAWCNRANRLDDMGRSMDALQDCDRPLWLEPSFVVALNNQGGALMKLGRYEEALASFERAVRADASYSAAHANFGDALQRRLCSYGEDLASYDRALALDRNNPPYLVQPGCCSSGAWPIRRRGTKFHTAFAHLAGALGVPNWIALKYVPDWRRFLDRSDTPWYCKTRPFRQPSPGDWLSVFAEMESAAAMEVERER